MKPGIAKAIRECAALTAPVCASKCSTSKYRCCDRFFCNVAEATMKALGGNVARTEHPELPFMGANGCVMPPEYRPVCAGFVCFTQLTSNRKLRREWQRLNAKILGDADVQAAIGAAREIPGKPPRVPGADFESLLDLDALLGGAP